MQMVPTEAPEAHCREANAQEDPGIMEPYDFDSVKSRTESGLEV